MTKYQQYALFTLRIVLGWLYFYAGITKVLDPSWSAAGYLKGAKDFAVLYQWMLDPAMLSVVNFLNEWGLLLLGVSLLIGSFVRYSALAGIGLMALYYLVILDFPYPNTHALIVDEHIVYIVALALLIAFDAGKVWGFDGWWSKRKEMTKKV
jgi:thiosulfate dehydrogenase [quinone] large subunit